MIKRFFKKIFTNIQDLNITKKIHEFIKFNNNYKLLIISSSIAFYFLLSTSSVLLLFLFFNKYLGESFDFLLIDIFSILGSNFKELINELNLRLTNNSMYSIILIITSIVSVSSIISDLNYFCDQLYFNDRDIKKTTIEDNYTKIKKKSYLRRRLDAFIILFLLLGIIIFEIGILLFGKYIIIKIFKNFMISKIIFRFIEYLTLYLITTLLYLYLPPIKISAKEIKKTSIIISLLIYIILYTLRVILRIITNYNIFNSLSYNILIICYVILIIIYIFIFGLVKNYQKNN